ncbi:MAG: hypothetical protein ACFFCM_22475 [Promethearchaeota archaeon]
MKIRKNYISDIKDCITRFYRFEDLAKKWLNRGGGNLEIFTYLNLQGDSSLKLPKHPFLDYNDDEKIIFKQCFGKPLVVPKDLNIRISLKDFLQQVKERRDFMRECASMTPQSRFRGAQYNEERGNKKPKKK